MVIPNRPISFMPSTMSAGYVSACSSSCACGMTSLSTNERTVARISDCTSVRPAVWARRAITAPFPVATPAPGAGLPVSMTRKPPPCYEGAHAHPDQHRKVLREGRTMTYPQDPNNPYGQQPPSGGYQQPGYGQQYPSG